MFSPVLARYQARLRQLETEVKQAGRRQTLILLSLACFFVLAAFALKWAASQNLFLLIYGAALAIVPALLARDFATNRAAWRRSSRLHGWYTRGVSRLDGSWPGTGENGDCYHASGHAYERDLNIVGNRSLFQLLSAVRTGIGGACLARFLLDRTTPADAKARQAAVKELRDAVELRERVSLLGTFGFRDSTPETFLNWVGTPAKLTAWPIRVLAAVNSLFGLAIVFCLVATSLPRQQIVPFIPPVVLISVIVAWACAPRTSAVKLAMDRIALEIGVFRSGIDLITQQSFTSPMLCSIQQSLTARGRLAVRRLERLTTWLEISHKAILFPLPNLLTLRTQISFAAENWKHKYGSQLPDWLNSWGEFQALLAISAYAHEHPRDVFPVFTESSARYEARALGHPLLPADGCIRNDFSLGPHCRFCIVSGSNMAGKSTLLRTVGINLVLAYAGAPVRAESLILSDLTVCASLAVHDSILAGKSKFLAEVERLRCAVSLARDGKPVLFLIDEILSGTNSRDRRQAAESILRILLEHDAIGAISTHDLSLAEIADSIGVPCMNLHMGSGNEADPMDFDYLLKPGISRETNALAIVKLIV